MANRGRATYDLNIGGEYIHTNIYHFHRSLGSFADPRTYFKSILAETIAKQEGREEIIDKQFKDAGMRGGIDEFLQDLRNIQNIINNVWKIGEVTRAAYLPKDFDTWDASAFKTQAGILRDYLNKMSTFHDNAMQLGGYKAEDVDSFMPGYRQLKSELDKIVKGFEAGDVKGGSNLQQQLSGIVNRFKGLGFEGVMGSAIAGILAGFKHLEDKNVSVELTGMVQRSDGRQVKVDALPKIEDWEIGIGISFKATREKTLQSRWGATLHSGTVGSIAKIIQDTQMGPALLGDQFKYFLINLSRMRDYAQAYGQEVRGPSKITDYPEYYRFTQEIARTYATFFIGEELPGRADVELPQLFNVDILILGDRIYKKSELLKEIDSGEMDARFKIKQYLPQPQAYWDQFDITKRLTMAEVSGEYSEVFSRPFMAEAVKKLLPQKVAITLHAIVGK